jgi:hypothetical protein
VLLAAAGGLECPASSTFGGCAPGPMPPGVTVRRFLAASMPRPRAAVTPSRDDPIDARPAALLISKYQCLEINDDRSVTQRRPATSFMADRVEAIAMHYSCNSAAIKPLTQQWVDRLEQAQSHNSLDDELRRLDRYRLLVIDEIGYLPLERQTANLLFALIARHYERGSIIVTSNRGFEA